MPGAADRPARQDGARRTRPNGGASRGQFPHYMRPVQTVNCIPESESLHGRADGPDREGTLCSSECCTRASPTPTVTATAGHTMWSPRTGPVTVTAPGIDSPGLRPISTAPARPARGLGFVSWWSAGIPGSALLTPPAAGLRATCAPSERTLARSPPASLPRGRADPAAPRRRRCGNARARKRGPPPPRTAQPIPPQFIPARALPRALPVAADSAAQRSSPRP